jgi:hypothetical protein
MAAEVGGGLAASEDVVAEGVGRDEISIAAETGVVGAADSVEFSPTTAVDLGARASASTELVGGKAVVTEFARWADPSSEEPSFGVPGN